jgi:hypothetical protein
MKLIDSTDKLTQRVFPWRYSRRQIMVVHKFDDCRKCNYYRITDRNKLDFCEAKHKRLEVYLTLSTLQMVFYDSYKIPDWCPLIGGKVKE